MAQICRKNKTKEGIFEGLGGDNLPSDVRTPEGKVKFFTSMFADKRKSLKDNQ